MKKVTVLILLMLSFMGYAENEEYSLLFVGNSLTSANDLPKLVQQNAASKGITVKTKKLTKGNYAIVDHWVDGRVQDLIKSREYDFVIIQQGPSSQQDGYDMLINGGRQYSDLTKAYGSKLAYYMVWPARMYYHTFDGVIANYTAGAEANDAILCPVGMVWKKHFDETSDFSYYGPDNFHPSLKGSKVAADVIVDSLFAETVPSTPANKQVWLSGLGEIEDNSIIVSDITITENGSFGPNFDVNEIDKKSWGDLMIEFNTCHTADMSYTSSMSLDGYEFGSGGYSVERVAMNESAMSCVESGFSNIENKAFFSGSFYGGPERDGEGLMIDYLNENQAVVTWYTYMPDGQQ